MASSSNGGYAFNRTRQAFVASNLRVAKTYWSRLRGLMGTDSSHFGFGQGLWIVPCRGIHTLAMNFPIDVLYLDSSQVVVHIEENVVPWRLAPVRLDATSVVELPARTVWTTGTMIGDVLEIGFSSVELKANSLGNLSA
jgi:hypothetical protein